VWAPAVSGSGVLFFLLPGYGQAIKSMKRMRITKLIAIQQLLGIGARVFAVIT
jgi:hypothetical protein